MEKPVNINEWEFIFEKATEEYPLGYYLYKPTNTKYKYEDGIIEIVGEKNELYIYNMWWFTI